MQRQIQTTKATTGELQPRPNGLLKICRTSTEKIAKLFLITADVELAIRLPI